MSSEKENGQEKAMSIVDVDQRIKDGGHAMIMYLIAVALVACVFILHGLQAISMRTLVILVPVIIVVTAIIMNAGFFARLWLVHDAGVRRADVGRELTPETNCTESLCNAPYDEIVQKQPGDNHH